MPVLQQKAKERLELIYLNVGEPVTSSSVGGARYWLTFIDDYAQVLRTDQKVRPRMVWDGYPAQNR